MFEIAGSEIKRRVNFFLQRNYDEIALYAKIAGGHAKPTMISVFKFVGDDLVISLGTSNDVNKKITLKYQEQTDDLVERWVLPSKDEDEDEDEDEPCEHCGETHTFSSIKELFEHVSKLKGGK